MTMLAGGTMMILRFFALLPMIAVVHGITSCGTQAPDKAFATLDRARMNLIKETKHGRRVLTSKMTCDPDELCKGCIEVQTYFHLLLFKGDDGSGFIPHPTNAVEQYLAGDTTMAPEDFTTSVHTILEFIDTQMVVLNEHYHDTPFYFTLMDPGKPSLTVNTKWSQFTPDSEEELDIGEALHMGNLATLNIYMVFSILTDDGGDFVGLSRFPSYQNDGVTDGIFLRYDTLPCGGYPLNQKGMTLVHEAGHWLGLYHTWDQNLSIYPACDNANPGDFIDDTPQQANATLHIVEDCTIFLEPKLEPLPDSCPDQPGLDPVFNYMNYVSSEECHVHNGEFTCLQVERMYFQWLLYRDNSAVCNDGKIEVSINIKFEESTEQGFADTFQLTTAKGKVIWDSTTDYDAGYSSTGTGVGIALCLPCDDYIFTYNDAEGDGFALDEDAFIEARRNGKLVDKVAGDFGEQAVIEINHDDHCKLAPPLGKGKGNTKTGYGGTRTKTGYGKGKGKGKGTTANTKGGTKTGY